VRRFWLVPAMLAAAMLYAAVDEDAGWRTWWRLRQGLEASRERVDDLSREIAHLSEASRELAGDPFAMERAIREDLGLARPGEIVVRFSRSGSRSPRNP
jgi:cell division protein FtsB